MKKLILPLILTSLVGCAGPSGWSWDSVEVEPVSDDIDVAESEVNDRQVVTEKVIVVENDKSQPRIDAEQPQTTQQASLAFQQDYRNALLANMNSMQQQKPNQRRSNKDINFYVRGLMQDLVSNMQYVNTATPLAITSFVMLDSDYQSSDILGMQIAESFIHEVHKFGIPVLDFKTTEYIRVTPQGDFILSKDYLELEGELPIKYVVAGTMTKQLNGILLNARIIGLESKAVVASAQGFLPTAVVNSLVSSGFNDGIPMVVEQGE